MAVSRAAGMPNQSAGGGIDYIPQLYAKGVRVKYYETATVPAIANTDYEGEIKDKGDKVKIRTIPDVTISDYAKGSTFDFENLASDSIELSIDYAKKYAFKIDDVDEKQHDIVLAPKFIENAGHKQAEVVDEEVFANIFSDAHASNQGIAAGAQSGSINLGVSGAPFALTKENILDFLVDMKTVLTEQNVPDDKKRWVVLPPWATGLIDKSDLKNASFSGEDKSRMYKNGYVGELAGFTIHESNKLYKVTDGSYTATNLVFGHRDALTFAGQMVKNSSVELANTFGRGYKGLNVFGFKVIVPEAMGWAYVRKG